MPFLQKTSGILGTNSESERSGNRSQKKTDVKEWPIPRRVKDVRSFLGLTRYYWRFIKDYGAIAKPLHELTEKNTLFVWTKVRNEAFEKH